jgi:hypothetical protein
LFQPLTNRAISSGAITIRGGNIAAENICPLSKQTKRGLLNGVSFQFKETVLIAGRTFTSKRNRHFVEKNRETWQQNAAQELTTVDQL